MKRTPQSLLSAIFDTPKIYLVSRSTEVPSSTKTVGPSVSLSPACTPATIFRTHKNSWRPRRRRCTALFDAATDSKFPGFLPQPVIPNHAPGAAALTSPPPIRPLLAPRATCTASTWASMGMLSSRDTTWTPHACHQTVTWLPPLPAQRGRVCCTRGLSGRSNVCIV